MNIPVTFGSAQLPIGKRIYRERTARGWTLEALAHKVGVSKVTVWSWEHGKCQPRLAMLDKLSLAFGIPATELYAGGGLVEASVPELIAACRERIAEAVGVDIHDVEIRVTFASLNS